MSVSISDAPWLKDRTLQKLLAVLSADGEEARIAGGAVRNALLGEPVTDIDIATTCLPDETERRTAAAGFKPVPTGKAHGTITVVAHGKPFEVTTLRADVENHGRHATVAFGRDWQVDAERRDFTINALYATADGHVIDLVGGIADLQKRNLRFIGNAEDRIREDYLRILRFYRFFAWYGSGRPDAEGIKASARLKSGLSQLSAERIWAELKKILSAPDPSRALLWMRQSGVLTAALPESEKWGIDAVPGLIAAGRDLGWAIDPMLRLMSIIPPTRERVDSFSERLKLSKNEAKRLDEWAGFGEIPAETSEIALAKRMFSAGRQPAVDKLKIALAAARTRAVQNDLDLVAAGQYSQLLKYAEGWDAPKFPIQGRDLVALGAPQDERLGKALATLKDEWTSSGFIIGRDALLERARDLLKD
ncbi:CCA tRNA nucleotidyltransferase [Mesorhizobium sp. YIM 152430]|uniref:CCA tRNA nucleotidyltransferase n=1 Tax=Mesorhizobium sp. YIM 152430 TaxID=3031761 RepID=UPI0023DAA710|nr:CCA tRNA nucleotidyltransferase [Mesorhizobium sp. YIM 152430]MDF1598602.1 CCA tRNA nucleotidyltransferase [Mesorhizobium sp. YIM 152430]